MSTREPDRLHVPASVASIGEQRAPAEDSQIGRERSERDSVWASEASTARYK
jgi:hypothetical protein